VAYQACSIPAKNNQSIYDHGVSACLWVSAFEILSHPMIGNSNKFRVSELLGNYNWQNSIQIIKKSFYRLTNANKLDTNSEKINLIQRLYFELNNLRNDFLHGNKIKNNSIRPFKKIKNKSFIYYAPLIYKIALISFLEKLDSIKGQEIHSIEDELLQRLYRSDYEDPIRKILLDIKR
jgi:hypothetical protein